MEGCRTTNEEGPINTELITGTKSGLAKANVLSRAKVRSGNELNLSNLGPVLSRTELQLVRHEGDA